MKSASISNIVAAAIFAAGFASHIDAATATIDVKTWHQKITGFGTCSAWNGTLTAAEGDQLWSTTKGAGLSLHRVMIEKTGTPDVNEQSNAKLATGFGVKVWGTPWYSKYATTPAGKSYDTLAEINMQAWANDLATGAKTMKSLGAPLYAVSPQNESDLGWVKYDAKAMALWVGKYLGPTMASQVPEVKIMAAETCNWWGLGSYEPVLIADADVMKYSSIFATHEYGGTVKAYPAIQAAGKEFWETEIYDPNTGVEDTGMTSALRVVALIHEALTVANMNAWHYWWIKPCSGCANGALWAEATKRPTKRLWIMGNFSRFVRPGFVRIDGTVAPTSGVTLSAYRDSALTKVVVVAINTNSGSTSQSFSITGATPTKVTPWITDPTRNIVADPTQTLTSSNFTYSLPATSVTTLVFDIQSSTGLADAAQLVAGNASWSAGMLTIPGAKAGQVRIIDVNGRSRTLELIDGHAPTGLLPAGIYQARLVGVPNTTSNHFLVYR